MSLRAGRVRGCLNIAPRAVPVRALTPPGAVDPPEPLFSEAMIQVKGTYGRARPNPAFGSPTLPQWLRAHARPVLIALAAFCGVLATLELLVYVARVLPWRPTVAILARVEWAYLALVGLALGLMLYQFIWNKLESVPA